MIKRMLASLCLLILSSGVQCNIQSDVNKLIKQINPHANLGMMVVDLTSGKTLYQRNANHLFIPASNMKLFSEAAALMVLGPDYHFKNQLSISSGKIQHGVLHGNIYIQLEGDPSFSRDDLNKLLASLRTWNIRTIQGNIYIDSSLAHVDPYPPGWLTSDLSYSYGAPNAPIILDANRLTVTVNPGAKAGDPAIVEADDGESGAITIHNQATTKANTQECSIGFWLDQENHLTTHGCLSIGQWAVQQQIAIKNPLAYAQNMIKSNLVKANIQLHGQIELGKTPEGTLLIAKQYSKSLSELMADTLKPSDNLYADSLYLHTATKLHGASVNWSTAEPIIKDFLQKQTGVNFARSIFTDGSGLSRYSLVTPEQTIALLKFLNQQFPLSYEYIASLPVAGRDGTLHKRFRNPTQRGLIRAKTGTMTGINSLSGYLHTANNHLLAFAMYINKQPGKSSGPGRPLLDALCAYFLQLSPETNHHDPIFSNQKQINFQFKPNKIERQKVYQAKWRRLESAIRAALREQPSVNIIYRSNELVIKDNQSDANKVWASLQSVVKKHPFSVILHSKTLSINPINKPLLLWVQSTDTSSQVQRIWTIKDAT